METCELAIMIMQTIDFHLDTSSLGWEVAKEEYTPVVQSLDGVNTIY